MTSLSKKIILEIFIAISISLLVILYSDSVIFSYIFKLYNITHLEPSFVILEVIKRSLLLSIVDLIHMSIMFTIPGKDHLIFQ